VKRPKYIAVCNPVREVSLRGTADLQFWSNKLESQQLEPTERDGKANLLIIAGRMKYMGIEFTEVSFSIEIEPPQPAAPSSAVFLMQAFNSSRVFTLCERTLFGTPYSHARCRLSTSIPALVEVEDHGNILFRAQMARDAESERSLAAVGQQGWEGPIYLARDARPSATKRKLYFASIKGETRAMPFDAEKDVLTICTTHIDELQSLRESNFTPTEWLIRENATHARTKTVQLSGV
jgi:hypothetical protein